MNSIISSLANSIDDENLVALADLSSACHKVTERLKTLQVHFLNTPYH
jgi:hypothetical protein